MSRLPLRLRLVAGFSAAMLFVLVGADAFVYWRVQYALDRALDEDADRARDALDDGVRAAGWVESAEAATALGAVYQVLSPEGAVLQHGAGTPDRSLVPLDELGSEDHVDVGALLPVSSAPLRLLVTRERTATGADVYLVVGVRRDHRDEALRELLGQLALAGLGASVVTAVVGDRLARSALRPVERFRVRAEEIASGASRLRLDLPEGRDDEVTRLGGTLNEMLDALDRAVDAERRFVDDASHELRTPLTLLTGRIQQAQRRTRSVSEHEAVLEGLAVDVDRLRALADQLLELGVADDERSEGRSGSTPDARPVIEDVARRHPAAPATRLPDVAVPVAMSPLALARVVTNLLDNAALHGTPPIEVTLTSDDEVALTVVDHGPGLPVGLRATDRFTRAEDAQARPGSGLGLSIVAELVTAAGGRLALVNRQPGLAATVHLRRPRLALTPRS